jgi:hypothetical protein
LFTFTRTLPGTYVNGEVVTPAPVVTSAWGIQTSVTARDLGIGNISGTLIQIGDQKLLVSVLAAEGGALPEPRVDDTALVGAKLYSIKNVDALQPGGVPVMYTLVVRA